MGRRQPKSLSGKRMTRRNLNDQLARVTPKLVAGWVQARPPLVEILFQNWRLDAELRGEAVRRAW